MKSAVLIIDVQCGLFNGNPEPFEAEEVVERINSVTSRAKAAGIPVFFIQHEQAGGLLEYKNENWKLHPGLKVENSDFRIRKTTPDSFLRTDLEKILTSIGIKKLIICGYASEFCIDTTVRSAAASGYSVQLVSDAHTTHDKTHASAKAIRQHHNATLPNITSFGPEITVVRSENVSFTEKAEAL